MKAQVLIETYTNRAYHAIRPAFVAAKVGYLGVSGMTFSATIFQKDYPYLVDVINLAAQKAGVHRDEYNILTLQNISMPPKTDEK